jgi:hypothetical protein
MEQLSWEILFDLPISDNHISVQIGINEMSIHISPDSPFDSHQKVFLRALKKGIGLTSLFPFLQPDDILCSPKPPIPE